MQGTWFMDQFFRINLYKLYSSNVQGWLSPRTSSSVYDSNERVWAISALAQEPSTKCAISPNFSHENISHSRSNGFRKNSSNTSKRLFVDDEQGKRSRGFGKRRWRLIFASSIPTTKERSIAWSMNSSLYLVRLSRSLMTTRTRKVSFSLSNLK